MKGIWKTAIMAVLAAAAVLVPSRNAELAQAATRSNRAAVNTLDEVYFDGTYLKMTYTVDSRCKAPDHQTVVEFETDTTGASTRGTVVGLHAKVYDVASESSCTGREVAALVTNSVNMAQLVDEEINSLKDDGYDVDPDYSLQLPPLSPLLPYDSHAKLPAQGEGGGIARPGTGGDNNGEVPVPPHKVKVVQLKYVPYWGCTLRKNDGSSRDGYEGTGSTMQEALQQSVRGCSLALSGDRCNAFASDPNHTTCDAQLGTKETTAEFDSDKLPAGAKTDSFTCRLMKNDGSRKDGFSGTAATEADARAQAASSCKGTNNPLCEAFSKDDAHTACDQRIVVEGPRPVAQWTCNLFKNDGARKDGFSGTGASRAEAQQNAAASCSSTHHPSCAAFSQDPAHTTCNAEFVYPNQ